VLCHQFIVVQVTSPSGWVLRITSSHLYKLHHPPAECYVSPVHLYKLHPLQAGCYVSPVHLYKLHPLQAGCYVSLAHTCTRYILKPGTKYTFMPSFLFRSGNNKLSLEHKCDDDQVWPCSAIPFVTQYKLNTHVKNAMWFSYEHSKLRPWKNHLTSLCNTAILLIDRLSENTAY